MNRVGNPDRTILIADDETHILRNLEGILRARGFEHIITCNDARTLPAMVGSNTVEVLLLDLTMPYRSGIDLLPELHDSFPDMPIIVITGTSEIEVAVQCMKLGAFDYLVKAIDESKLITTVSHALALCDLRRENAALKNHLVSSSLEHPEALRDYLYSLRFD